MATSNFAYTTYSNRSRRTRSSSPPRSRVSTGSLGHHDDVGMSTSSAPLARRPGGNSTTPPVSTSSMHAHAGLYMSCPPPRMLCRGLEQDAMEARVRSLPTHHKCLTLSLPTFIPVIAIQDSSSSSFRTMAPVGNKPNHKGKAVLAGGLSGAFEICCTFPTEYVKTTQQLSSKSMSVKEVISGTMAESGVLGFYRGLSSMLYFAAPKAAIRFSAFEFFSGCLTDANGGDKYGLGQAKGFLAGLGAGTMEAIFVTTPQETIKIKLIHDQFRGTNKYNGFFHGVKTIIAEEKISGVYRGLLPTVMKVSTAQATRFGIFTVIKDYVTLDNALKNAAAGATAGGISVLAFQGIDVVKSRMQGLEAAKYKSTLDCVGQIMKNEGIAGFYKGVGPRLTRVCLEVGITMSLYGEIVKFLDTVWDTTPKVPMPH